VLSCRSWSRAWCKGVVIDRSGADERQKMLRFRTHSTKVDTGDQARAWLGLRLELSLQPTSGPVQVHTE
jgi:hypothetical protein